MLRKGKDGELTIVNALSIEVVVVFPFVGRHISVVNFSFSLFNMSFTRI